MKKIFYTFSLLLGLLTCLNGVNAQNVNIPDPNFRSALIAQGVDTNGDGTIQVSEAQGVSLLNVSNNNITDLSGIEEFINLEILDCTWNNLTDLNVSSNVNLTQLISTENQLTDLDVSSNLNLEYLICNDNQLTNLNVSNCANLVALYSNNNQLANLDISDCLGLEYLRCNNNQLTYLITSSNENLITLYCSSNQLVSLDLSNNINLITVDCHSNALHNLNLYNAEKLEHIYCQENNLSNLDISENKNLHFLNCKYNGLSLLDASKNAHLTTLDCSSNSITDLIIKNGNFETILLFDNNPINYICADVFQFIYIKNLLQQLNINNVFMSSLCIYDPGGDYNTVIGTNRADTDINEVCTSGEPGFPNIPLAINLGGFVYYSYASKSGFYLAYLDSGAFTITPQVQNAAYSPVNPVSIYFPDDNYNFQDIDFCLVPNGHFPDVEISLIPLGAALPGFSAHYLINYQNNGVSIANGNITLDFEGNKMTYLSSTSTLINQTSNQVAWSYNNLQPFQSGSIYVTMSIQPIPIVNIGDSLNFTATIYLPNDINPSDNIASMNQPIVGAYDPNDKTCLEGHVLNNSKIGEYLHYMVRFQNTGNYPAQNVVIVDTLDDTKYDLQSLQIIETSHECHIDLYGKVLQFYFEDIQLADSFSNEPESHGFVVYKIKTKNTLPLNSSVSNKAEIYFDYNPPIVTNLETTTFTNTVSIDDLAQVTRFKCYPNPAQSILTIETQKQASFVIFNGMGESVKEFTVNDKENIDISGLPQGIYFLRARHETGGVSFVKE